MKPIFFAACSRAFSSCVLALWLWCFSVQAGGTVTEFTQAALQQALTGGGMVTFAANGTITLTNTITIALTSTIDAAGYDVTISGSNAVRLFKVNTNVQFTVKDLKLIDGKHVGVAGGEDGMGGAILSQGGIVTLVNCMLSNHVAQGANGTPVGGVGGRGLGGAVCSLNGSINATNCVIQACTAVGGQGDPPTGDAGAGFGGALYLVGGTANLHGLTVLTNMSKGGAPHVGQVGSRAGEGAGGVLYATNSTLIASACIIRGNYTQAGYARNGTYDSKGTMPARGGAFFLDLGTTVTLTGTAFVDNKALGGSAAYAEPGSEGRGGGVFSLGTLWILGCSFESCQASGGGSRYTPAPGRGGAVWASGATVANSSTFRENMATGGNCANDSPATGEGGAIYTSGILTATNCSWTGNTALSGSFTGAFGYNTGGKGGAGGAVFCSGGTATLEHITASGDCVGKGYRHEPLTTPRGAAIAVEGGSVLLRNSILANSTNTLVWGSITDGGYNVCSDGTAAFTNTGSLNNTPPFLHNLADNGGPTLTMSLFDGSPCMDAIPITSAATDQRGVARPQGVRADIGAVENLPSDTANDPPYIFAQPMSVVVLPGAGTNFAVLAGGAPITYQWWHNSEPISGANQPAYPIASALAGAQGSYFVVLSNAVGVVTSSVATLSFDASALNIITQPVGTNVIEGAPVALSVLVSGISPVAYQWHKDGAPIAAGTLSRYALDVTRTNDAGFYHVVVTNGYRSVTSVTAQLVVTSALPKIISHPTSVVVAPGAGASFSVAAEGPLLSYRWWHNGIQVQEGGDSVYSIGSALAGAQGTYCVVVFNSAGAVTSSVATLTFDSSALNILIQPKSLVVAPGAPASFNVLASGIPNLTYQWLHNGIAVPGVTSSSFAIPSVQSGDGGEYSVIVMNDYKTITSATALLARGTSNPPLLSISVGGTNLFLTYAGAAGSSYRLLSCSDMVSWSGVATNVAATSGAQGFVVPVDAPAAFYRVVSP